MPERHACGDAQSNPDREITFETGHACSFSRPCGRCRQGRVFNLMRSRLVERQFDKDADAIGEHPQRFAERLHFLGVGSLHGGGIGDAPMGAYRLARPDGAILSPAAWSQTVKTKSHLRRPGKANSSQLLNASHPSDSRAVLAAPGRQMTAALGKLPAEKARKTALAFLVQEGFRQDRARRISGAQETARGDAVSRHRSNPLISQCCRHSGRPPQANPSSEKTAARACARGATA